MVVTTSHGITAFSEEQWHRFIDILLDHSSMGQSAANPVTLILSEVLDMDPYWVEDGFTYWNAFNDHPPTEIGYFWKHFEAGPDFWYDLFYTFEKDPEGGVKKIYEIVSGIDFSAYL